MKIRLIISILAILLITSIQLNAALRSYRIVNNMDQAAVIGSCTSMGGATTCNEGMLDKKSSGDFQGTQYALTSIYWRKLESNNKERELMVTNPHFTTFTINPDGSITGQ